LRKVQGRLYQKTKWCSKYIISLNSHNQISAPKINNTVHKAVCWGMKNLKVSVTLSHLNKIRILLILQVLVRCFLVQWTPITQSIWIQSWAVGLQRRLNKIEWIPKLQAIGSMREVILMSLRRNMNSSTLMSMTYPQKRNKMMTFLSLQMLV